MSKNTKLAEQPETLHDLDLPTCIERRSDGAIVVRGHRVTLHSILRHFFADERLGEMQIAFPTVAIETLAEVVRFCQEHSVPLRDYFDEQERLMEAWRLAQQGTAPSIDELRRRMARRRQSG